MVSIKICGLRRVADALIAARAGAHSVGVLVGQNYPSPDFLEPDDAREIVKALPPFCSSVMVTHLTDDHQIVEFASYLGVQVIQLHGGSSPETTEAIRSRLPSIKLVQAVHVRPDVANDTWRPFVPLVDAILLDTTNPSTGQVGGTGIPHNWNLSRRIVEECAIPVILAGGLNPNNVVSAIQTVRPYGVDVNSGVKSPDGYKDSDKVHRFIQAASRS